MEQLINLLSATFTWEILLLILGGTVFGMLVGAIPGLNTTLAVAIIIPVTFYLEPVAAMALLIAVYKSGTYGGSISAILLGVPGTPAAAATVQDGHALAKRGQAIPALEMALYASTFADIVSNLSLIFIASYLAKFALRFGPAENTMLVLFALVVVSIVSSQKLIKGLLAASIGLTLAVIGMDPMTGFARFTFGNINILSGVTLIPSLVGLFAISEIFMEYSHFKRGNQEAMGTTVIEQGNFHLRAGEFLHYWKTMLKSSLIGVFIGALPGSGAATASFISYSEAKRTSENPQEYGKGSLEGIAASEAGNNGVCGATLIPLLTMGIPGDSITAIMFGALVLQGITPGPLVFTQQGEIIRGIFITLFICSLFMFVVGRIGVRTLSTVMKIPAGILYPLILVISFAGSYAINNSMYDMLIMLVSGVVGYLLRQFGMPVAPTLIGFILGTQFEKSMLQALIKSRGSYAIFCGSPITVAFCLLIALFIGFYNIKSKRSMKN